MTKNDKILSPFDLDGCDSYKRTKEGLLHAEEDTRNYSRGKDSDYKLEDNQEHPHTKPLVPEERRLGVVFDIDGTLIAEIKRDFYSGIKIRPGAIEFITWLKKRGHAASIWTKASKPWAHRVVQEICPLVYGPHECSGLKCHKTFDFVWCFDKCKVEKDPSLYWQIRYAEANADIDDCKWCEAYGSTCRQCECAWDLSQCPCRHVKDLRKVFGYAGASSTDKTSRMFTKERTIIVEDTPQNCRYNYGNAIYVPTYRGCVYKEDVFAKMQSFFENELESCEDVRFYQKCDHGKHYHACYRQSWLTG
eukprot:CAMPEP_0183724460 /NCGR_PEP_ID=MMETSP0737-20130205/17944_1 /TAXON_ID=385413 /ORGANISM="Thalassiosira miniscula, Strain CCMP1093" /LENGTH=304 /DNA_ID=CAMNT_0025955057 /DNA_START=46 /DNA_END=960 /DNA_ORIENTATION=+